MTISLEIISEVIADVKKREYVLVKPTDHFVNDLELDSLNLFMVLVRVAERCEIQNEIERMMDGEEAAVERARNITTVEDLMDYVGHCSGK